MSRTRGETRGPLERGAQALLHDAARSMAKLETRAARALAEAAEAVLAALESGGTIYFCGNGGSAADAQHLAAELSGRYLMDRPALPAVALSTNSSAVTAIGNDFGFDRAFSRQLEGLGTPGDVLVAISTSGNSPNVLRAAETARARGMVVVGMTGARGGKLARRADVVLAAPSDSTPRIQEGHIALGHALCELVERALFAPREPARRTRRPAGSTAAPRPARARAARPSLARRARAARPGAARRAARSRGR
jgi:D-sedoheptulose 7-phosphate isomerase